jgi:DNA invertase Pin-like site-specific DNA recombinase
MSGALGYARVSTVEQAKENQSLAVQKKRIATYCEQTGCRLLQVFEDSESARSMERPRLKEMLDYCRKHKGKVSTVVVSDLSRLARNVQDQGLIIARLRLLGIELQSIDEPLTDDSAMGEFLRNMLGSVNQLFSDSLSERTRERMRAAVRRGQHLWGPPIGYLKKNKKLQLDPDRAPLVREAFELVASGRYQTIEAVLQVVTAMGLTTQKGKKVTKQTFSRMLANPIFAGWVVSGDIKVKGVHEPLITQELFDAVQDHLNAKAGPHTKLNEEFPLRGVVKCAACNKPLTAGWAKGRRESYPRYWCWTKGCRAVGVSREEIEKKLILLLKLMEPTAEFLAQLPDLIAGRWTERKERIANDASKLSRRLAEQKTLNQQAVKAKIKNEITQEDFESVKAEIAEEEERIKEQIKALDSERDTMEEMMRQGELEAVDIFAAWERSNVNQRQELVRSFFPDGLVFSMKNGFIEPANTLLIEMFMRGLEAEGLVGVPDGI